MRNPRKFKGTGIYFNEDLCPASQTKIKSQPPLMKQARSEGKIAYFKYTRLIIKERTVRSPASGTSPGDSAGPTLVAGGGGLSMSGGGKSSCDAGRVAAARETCSDGTAVAGAGGVVPFGRASAHASSDGGESGDDAIAIRDETTRGGEKTGASQQKLNHNLRDRKM